MAGESRIQNVKIPYVTIAEQAEGDVPAPDAGHQRVFIDLSDHLPKRKDSSDTVEEIGGVTELAFGKVSRTSGDYTTTSATFEDVDTTNISITLTTGARRCRLTLQATGGNGSDGGSINLDFTIDGTRVGQTIGLLFITTPAASNNQNCGMQFVTDLLTAGSHTFRVQWKSDSGTSTLRANTTTSPLVFTVEELNIST